MSDLGTTLTLSADGVELVIGTPIPMTTGVPTGPAGGQLDGIYPDPIVIGITETSGPTALNIGTIADGEFLYRNGADIDGSALPKLLTGSGSPVGAISGVLGQSYHDLVSQLFYRCISNPSGSSWVTI